MLSSIHPLGERARHNRWWITVAAMSVGSVAAGAVIGLVLGAAGAAVLPNAGEPTGLVIVGMVAVAAGAADLLKIQVPGPHRQVNETWIGPYRGWVYGGAFGAQLGAGVATFIVTFGVFAVFVAEVFAGSAIAASVIGAVFGAGRVLMPLSAGWIDRPSRLTKFHVTMAAWARPAARFAGIGLATVGVLLVMIAAV